MIVATTQDLELVGNCGCPCDITVCAEPRKECESLGGTGDLRWVIASATGGTPPYTYYRTNRWDWADGGYTLEEYDQGFDAYFDGCPSVPESCVSMATLTDESSGPFTGEITTTLSNAVDIDAARTAAIAALDAAIPWDAEGITKGDSCVASMEIKQPWVSLNSLFLATYARYRFGIPDGYDRSTYELQWDVGFFPRAWLDWKSDYDAWFTAQQEYLEQKAAWDACMADGGTTETCGDEPTEPDPFTDPEPSPTPSLLSSESWAYAGTGDFSDWYVLPTPESDGETKVVNLMVICYRSARIGQKPTSFGEIYAFPA